MKLTETRKSDASQVSLHLGEQMEHVYVTFRLDGWHAQHFVRVLAIANLAPGPRLSASEMAVSIIKAVLEDDAKDHDMPTTLAQ